MTILLSAKSTTIDGHEFDKRGDHKTVTAMMKAKLGLVD